MHRQCKKKKIPERSRGNTASCLWYRRPASEWKNGLPIGTGRLAAMTLGTVPLDRMVLNHEWLWRGTNRARDTEKRAHLLPEVRELLLSGDYEQGTLKGNEAFGGGGGIRRDQIENRVDPYQPASDLYFRLEHGEVSDYRRELNLENGLVTVAYTADGAHFRKEYLAHLSRDLILIHLTADKPFSGEFYLWRVDDPWCSVNHEISKECLALNGRFKGGIAFRVEARFRVRGGVVTLGQDRMTARKVEEMLIAIDVGTSAKDRTPESECAEHALPDADWDELLCEHVEAYNSLYGKLSLSVDASEPDLPTNERLVRLRKGESDPSMAALYFNFGRYLMIASAANAELPPNLQGKWNDNPDPPWECDYHHDINLQMNYWPMEAGRLEFAAEALFRHIERLVPHARKAARDLYDCKGVWFPLTTDAWGRATSEAFGWGVWIGAAAWLAQHLWWHYEYGLDLAFLRDRAYPFFKEAAAFYESYLIEDKNGVLQAVPSQSPENRFVGGGDIPVTLCVSATMDIQLIRDLLSHAIRSAEILNLDEEKRREWRSILDRLPPMRIGRHGQLQEWNEDFEEVEPGHRHFSHLFGFYPGEDIDPERTPDLWEAARVSLERRLSHHGGPSGWSRAWTSCMFARLGDADKAWEHFEHLMTDWCSDALLDLHPIPPGVFEPHTIADWINQNRSNAGSPISGVFQIDGNFGGVAAILEMLLQSCHEELHFLPALPAAWPRGAVRGLRAKGGYQIDIAWDKGCLARATIVSLTDRPCVILRGAGRYQVQDEAGATVQCMENGHRLCFNIKAGKPYTVKACPKRCFRTGF